MKPALTRAACLLCAAFASLAAPPLRLGHKPSFVLPSSNPCRSIPRTSRALHAVTAHFISKRLPEFTAAGSALNPDPGRTGTSIRWVRH